MINEWNMNFPQNSDLEIQHAYSSEFPLVEVPLLKSYLWDEFSVYKRKENCMELGVKDFALVQSMFCFFK